jgi:hypothetical protein
MHDTYVSARRARQYAYICAQQHIHHWVYVNKCSFCVLVHPRWNSLIRVRYPAFIRIDSSPQTEDTYFSIYTRSRRNSCGLIHRDASIRTFLGRSCTKKERFNAPSIHSTCPWLPGSDRQVLVELDRRSTVKHHANARVHSLEVRCTHS